LYALTSSNINRFSKLFHCQKSQVCWFETKNKEKTKTNNEDVLLIEL